MNRELSLTEKRQLRDEMRRARQMAAHMDFLIDALAPSRPRSFRDDSDCCPHCGKKHRGGFGCTCGDRP